MHNHISTTLRSLMAPTLALAVGLPAAQAADSSKTIVLKGEVDRFSTIDRDQQERGLVRIKLANGRTAIVDLGERRDVQQLDIERGDHVRIEGSRQSRGDQSVIAARRLQIKEGDSGIATQGHSRSEFRNISASQRRSDSRSHFDENSEMGSRNLNERDRDVLRQGTSRSEHRNISASERRVDHSGTIVDTRSSRGSAGEATLVKLELENGRNAYVVVPPQFDLSRVAIKDAERMRVGGIERSDKDYVVAQRLRIDGQDIRQDQQRRQDQQKQEKQASARLQGTVESFSTTRLKGAPEDNVFGKVRLQDGSSRIVDFGPISKVDLIRMQKGDQVTIEGMLRKLGDRKVLEARHVRIQAEGRQDRRMMRSGLERSTVKNQSEPMMLKGTVAELKKVRLQGEDEKISAVKITLQDGTSRIVNLTPRLARQFLDIEQGDTVVANGYKRQVNDRTIGIVDGIVVLENEG